MHRQPIAAAMQAHQQLWGHAAVLGAPVDAADEAARQARIAAFVADHPACCERSTLAGHVTGSALVVSADLQRVLLTLHAKLGLWLQLGGHADGDPLVHQVAMREAREESGLTRLRFLRYEPALARAAVPPALAVPIPFDYDHHAIPARKTEPAHIHYDIRYLIVASADEPLVISAESKDLRWFTLEEAAALTAESSMQRQFAKLAWLRTYLATVPGHSGG